MLIIGLILLFVGGFLAIYLLYRQKSSAKSLPSGAKIVYDTKKHPDGCFFVSYLSSRKYGSPRLIGG